MSAKFPRIAHLPFSPGATPDDERAADVRGLTGRPVVLTEKLDGANAALRRDVVYARSHSGPASGRMFDELKAHHAAVRHLIPESVTVFVEWCRVVHSIRYEDGPDGPFPQLFVIGVRDDDGGVWSPWEALHEWAGRLGCAAAPRILVDVFDTFSDLRDAVEAAASAPSRWGPRREGVVVRTLDGFGDEEFGSRVAKYVNQGFEPGAALREGSDLERQPGRIGGW